MEEFIGTRDPSGFAKVMLAHLQDFNICIDKELVKKWYILSKLKFM